MSNLTYEELQAENEKLRAKLLGDADEEFTEEVKRCLPSRAMLFNEGFIKGDKITIRPAELWRMSFLTDGDPSTRDLAKFGRSLQALGWARSAKNGNLVFTISVAEYAR